MKLSNLWILCAALLPAAGIALTREEWEATQSDKDAHRLERAWQEYDVAQRVEAVTNIAPEEVVTNYPPNYAERLALVPLYQAAASNLNVYGMEPMAARIALKQRAAAETNTTARIALVEAATDLIYLRESLSKIGVDLTAVGQALDVTVTTNAARTNITYRLRN